MKISYFCLEVIFFSLKSTAIEDCPLGSYRKDNRCHPCGQCRSGKCVDISGGCVQVNDVGGCHPGWRPTQLCDKICEVGSYGDGCSQQCGHCNHSMCHHVSGHCKGCQPGYLYTDRLCKRECFDNFYGQNCDYRCGNCHGDDMCNKTNGRCPGECEAGFVKPFCLDRCESGKFGLACNQTCGQCYKGENCHYSTGACRTCAPGYLLPDCIEECPDGQYGDNCRESCGACADHVPCDKRTGVCPGGCIGKNLPPLCKSECLEGFYGTSCNQLCGNCLISPCDSVTGACSCPDTPNRTESSNITECQSCLPGFNPPLCKAESKDDSGALNTGKTLAMDVGLGVGLPAGLLLLVGITLLVLWKMKKRPKEQQVPKVRLSLSEPLPSQSDSAAVDISEEPESNIYSQGDSESVSYEDSTTSETNPSVN